MERLKEKHVIFVVTPKTSGFISAIPPKAFPEEIQLVRKKEALQTKDEALLKAFKDLYKKAYPNLGYTFLPYEEAEVDEDIFLQLKPEKPKHYTIDDVRFKIRFLDVYPTLLDEIPLRGARDEKMLELHGEIVKSIENLRQYLELI